MENVRWSHYFSKNIRRFQSGGIGFLGLFITAEVATRIAFPDLVVMLSPAFDLLLYTVCFALYWHYEHLLKKMPDRGWSVSSDRSAARLEIGRRRAGWLAVIVASLSVCIILVFAPEKALGAVVTVAAAWLGLHWVRARELWGFLSVAFCGFAVLGPFYLVAPQYVVDEATINMLLWLEFGVAMVFFAFFNHKELVRNTGLRGK